jgi:hypothetical protein
MKIDATRAARLAVIPPIGNRIESWLPLKND